MILCHVSEVRVVIIQAVYENHTKLCIVAACVLWSLCMRMHAHWSDHVRCKDDADTVDAVFQEWACASDTQHSYPRGGYER